MQVVNWKVRFAQALIAAKGQTTVCISDKVLPAALSAGVSPSSFAPSTGAPLASMILDSHALAEGQKAMQPVGWVRIQRHPHGVSLHVGVRFGFEECKMRRWSSGQFATDIIKVTANASHNFTRQLSKIDPAKTELSHSAVEGDPQQYTNVTQLDTEAC